jgi:PKD domain
MRALSWFRFLASLHNKTHTRPANGRRGLRPTLVLERLEDRLAPATLMLYSGYVGAITRLSSDRFWLDPASTIPFHNLSVSDASGAASFTASNFTVLSRTQVDLGSSGSITATASSSGGVESPSSYPYGVGYSEGLHVLIAPNSPDEHQGDPVVVTFTATENQVTATSGVATVYIYNNGYLLFKDGGTQTLRLNTFIGSSYEISVTAGGAIVIGTPYPPPGSNPAFAMLSYQIGKAQPTLRTTASPADITLGTMAPTLSDSADLEGGHSETGSINFTLSGPGGFSYTQTVPVNGNGMYRASTTLPTMGTVAGNYTWSASYNGDDNNLPATDDGANESTVVKKAQPRLTTTASPSSDITLGGSGAPPLNDSATLSGGYYETDMITFTLSGPAGVVDTETVQVNGDNTYTTPTGYTLPTSGSVAGIYTWTAHYSGDDNNKPADDQGGSAEQTVINPANPTLVTTANPATVTLNASGAPVLSDTAVLSGGYLPDGLPSSITFTLAGPGGFSYTQTDPITGNGTYSASTSLLGTSILGGTYTWTATYSGDANNKSAKDQGGSSEQTVVTLPAETAKISGPTIGVPGQPLTYTFSVAGATPRITYSITWGDGGSTVVGQQVSSLKVDHIYTGAGSFTIQLLAKDQNGVSASATQAVTIRTVVMEIDFADPSRTMLAVGGNMAGGDTIAVSATDTTGKVVNVTLNKIFLGNYAPTGHILVYGQGGKDSIKLNPYVVGNNRSYYIQVPAFLYGEGAGGDKISAAGSSANNVLSGHGTNEVLTGGEGRDLLIGGTGAATLNAGAQDDILIGGWTNYDITSAGSTYDQKLAVLYAIMAEWGSTDAYAKRLSLLAPYLNTNTVHDNHDLNGLAISDYLQGNAKANDWFFAGLNDKLKGIKNGDQITTIN